MNKRKRDNILLTFMIFFVGIVGIMMINITYSKKQNRNIIKPTPTITSTPIPTNTPIPTATLSPTVTPTPTPSPTPEPTATPEPTPTATPKPTATLKPTEEMVEDDTDNLVYGYYTITKEELQILYRIVEAEATDGTIEQKQNVASCIFARVESEEWPNSVKKVVFQKSQFSPISDGRYYSVKITEDTKTAVNYIVENGKQHNYIFFCSYGCKSSYFAAKDRKLAAKGQKCYRDGIHRYYLE